MTRLKGCSIHIVGPRTGATAAASLALARRLKEQRYRFLDLDSVVAQLLGAGAAGAPAAELRAVETAVLAEAKAWSRTVLFCAGEPGLQSDNWAALHQGICVLVVAAETAAAAASGGGGGASGGAGDGSARVSAEAAAGDELWVEQSDVTVTLASNVRARGGAARRAQAAGGGRGGMAGGGAVGEGPRGRGVRLSSCCVRRAAVSCARVAAQLAAAASARGPASRSHPSGQPALHPASCIRASPLTPRAPRTLAPLTLWLHAPASSLPRVPSIPPCRHLPTSLRSS
jgi:hypothetical protein